MGVVTVPQHAADPADDRIIGSARGFYISQRLDRQLDRAVAYLRERHGLRRVDRSVVVSALLDRDDLWGDDALDQIVDRVVTEITGRLIRKGD